MTWLALDLCPINEDVLLLFDDGMRRIGQRYAASLPNGYRVTLDMGDAYAAVYCQQDYAPIAFMRLPGPPAK